MPIECPRCLLTNLDSSHTCECGYDLTAQVVKLKPILTEPARRPERAQPDLGMSKEWFLVGVLVVWALLTLGEWLRIRPELASRKALSLLTDSLLLSLTDMFGALIIGALGWIVVWIMLSYEGRRLRPCPKRTTLAVTVVAGTLLFFTRLISPDVLMQHVIHAVIVLGVAVFSYYAGCRGWLGKW